MLHDLLRLLPEEVAPRTELIFAGGIIVGVIFWVIGSRMSRALVTLGFVAAGAAVGMGLPSWVGWKIDGSATAVAGAIVLGITGFVTYRLWVGVLLGAVAAVWITLVAWWAANVGKEWTWPAIEEGMLLPQYLCHLWASLPEEVTRVLPFAWGAALICGAGLGMLWPRLSVVTLYSLLGTTLIAGCGLAVMKWEQSTPQWIVSILQSTWTQALAMGGMVFVGDVIQWQLGPRKRPRDKTKGDKGTKTDQKSNNTEVGHQ